MRRKRSEPLGRLSPEYKVAIDKYGSEKIEVMQRRAMGTMSSDRAADRSGDRIAINKYSKKGTLNNKEWYD